MQRAMMQRIFLLLLSFLGAALVDGAAVSSHHGFGGMVKTARHVVKRGAVQHGQRWEKRDVVAADFASQFSSTDDLHLLTTTIPALSSSGLLVISNTTHALFSLNVSSDLASSLGWVGLGLGGTSMASTHQMVIGIPDSSSGASSGWGLSNRAATGHVMPQPVSASAASPASLIDSLSSQPSGVFTFIVPFTRSSDAKQQGLNMVFAYSSTPASLPSNGDADQATIQQHDDGRFGSFVANLGQSATVNSDGTLSGGSQPGSASGGKTTYQKVIMWHAIIGALAWMIIAPTAVLIGRLGRNWGSWLKAHRALQAGLTVTLTFTAVILAAIAIKSNGGGFTAGGHQILGFLILIAVLIQASLGQYAHAKLDRNRTKRPGRNVTHIFLGCSLLIAGWVQVYLGLKLYNRVVPGGLPSDNLYLVWAVFLVLPAVLYALSCAFLVADRRRKQGMSWSMALFGLGRDGGTVPASARLTDNEKGWPPYVADLAATKDDDDSDGKGFFRRMFRSRRHNDRGQMEEIDAKVSPFAVYERDAFGNAVRREDAGSATAKEDAHLSWGNNGRTELDAFNQQALQRGFAMAVDAQDPQGMPIASQYTTGYGYAQTANYAADPNAARDRSGGMRELTLQRTLTNDPTAGYRAGSQPTRAYHTATSPETTGRTFPTVGASSPEDRSRVLYAGPSAYTGGHPTHARGQGSASGHSDASGHSAGSGGSRKPLVQGGYYNQGPRF